MKIKLDILKIIFGEIKEKKIFLLKLINNYFGENNNILNLINLNNDNIYLIINIF